MSMYDDGSQQGVLGSANKAFDSSMYQDSETYERLQPTSQAFDTRKAAPPLPVTDGRPPAPPVKPKPMPKPCKPADTGDYIHISK